MKIFQGLSDFVLFAEKVYKSDVKTVKNMIFH